jgi:hypothetical protein
MQHSDEGPVEVQSREASRCALSNLLKAGSWLVVCNDHYAVIEPEGYSRAKLISNLAFAAFTAL